VSLASFDHHANFPASSRQVGKSWWWIVQGGERLRNFGTMRESGGGRTKEAGNKDCPAVNRCKLPQKKNDKEPIVAKLPVWVQTKAASMETTGDETNKSGIAPNNLHAT
jgi:hypothetical protein